MTTKISIRRPDDFHLHVRQDEMMVRVLPSSARVFARALVMPNTLPPIKTAIDALKYRQDIQRCTPRKYENFAPLMTIKLGDWTTKDEIRRAVGAGVIAGKFYPEGATTNSQDGVKNIRDLYPIFEAMQRYRMVLCLHGEQPGVFCMDRESCFVQDELPYIVERFPNLKIVLEHVSTETAVRYIRDYAPPNVVATITVHHLMITLDDVIGDMLRPHHFCKPIAKTERDRQALRSALHDDQRKFFLGTDSAPHAPEKKTCDHGCAGIFSAPVALPLLAQIFEEECIIDKLGQFTSECGAIFYDLPLTEETISLVKEDWVVPNEVDGVVPFMAGQTLKWKIEGHDA